MFKGRVSCSLNTVRSDFALGEALALWGVSVPDLGRQVVGTGRERTL